MKHQLSLPDSIVSLLLWCDCPIIRMSKGVKLLSVGNHNTQRFEFPVGLEDLRWHPNRPVNVPKGLKILVLGHLFQQPLVLPQGLECVVFDDVCELPLIVPEGCRRADPNIYIDLNHILHGSGSESEESSSQID